MQPRRNKNFSQLPSEPDIQRIQQVNWFGTDFSLLLASCSELSTHIIMLPMRDRSSHIAPAECHDSCVPQCTNCGCGCGALQPSDWRKSFRMTWLCSSELEKGNLAVSGFPLMEFSVGMLCWQGLLGAWDHPVSGADSEVHRLPAILREQHAQRTEEALPCPIPGGFLKSMSI